MMHKISIDILPPEPKPNSSTTADGLPSAKLLPNPLLAAAFQGVKLTQNQIRSLQEVRPHWKLRNKEIINRAKSFGISISTDEEINYLIDVVCPREEARIKKQFFIDSQTGKRMTYLTPTDVKGDFTKIINPVIGVKYHISWAFSGAVFKLVKVEGDTCYLDNPKYKRKDLLKCKVSELRGLR